VVDRIKQHLVDGNRVVTSNQQVKRQTNVLRPSTSDASIESSLASHSYNGSVASLTNSSLASQSYHGSVASLTNSVIIRHKKTLNAFKKMDSRNHMAQQGRVVKSCQDEKRSSLMGDELMDRFLKKRASNPSRKSSIIKKNDSFKR
jgi:hypothetical protein